MKIRAHTGKQVGARLRSVSRTAIQLCRGLNRIDCKSAVHHTYLYSIGQFILTRSTQHGARSTEHGARSTQHAARMILIHNSTHKSFKIMVKSIGFDGNVGICASRDFDQCCVLRAVCCVLRAPWKYELALILSNGILLYYRTDRFILPN